MSHLSPQDRSLLVSFLHKTRLLRHLSETEITSLLPFVKILSFPAGVLIFEEGNEGHELFIVRSGQVEILKTEPEYGHSQQLQVFHPEEHFGEMAHLEKTVRSATARTVEPTEIVALDLDALKKNLEKTAIYSKIVLQLAENVSSHLRNANERLISFFKESLEMLQSHAQFSTLLIHFFIIAAIWFNTSLFIKLYLSQTKNLDHFFAFFSMVLFAGSAVYIIKTSGYRLAFYGLTTRKWFQHSVEGVLWSIPILLLSLLIKWVLIHHVDMFKHLTLLSLPELETNYNSVLVVAVFYALTAPLQELVARGFLQSCLHNFLRGPDRVFQAILTSNILFQMIHTAIGFWIAIVTFVLGIFWGILFEKQKSIVGACVSHAIVGTVGLFIFDFNAILDLAG